MEQGHIGEAAQRLVRAANAQGVPTGTDLLAFVGEVQAASARLDTHLLDIMVAQDFHDLTGQVLVKVVGLAADLEDGLLKLLLLAAPADAAPAADALALNGPVLAPGARGDVVSNQGEVDELLASLGF